MYPGRIARYECYICGRDASVIAYIDGRERMMCLRCFLAYTLHETIKHMLSGTEDDFRYTVRVLEGINDLVEDNPFAQAIRHVIDMWAQRYPKVLFYDDLRQGWRYRYNLDDVLSYLASEGVLVKAELQGRIILAPGDILRKLLTKYPTSREFFRDVIKAVTGLAVVRHLADPKKPKFRKIYATLQALAECINDKDSEPLYDIKGYKCKLCEKTFLSRDEIRSHIQEHIPEKERIGTPLDELYAEATGKHLGVWCKYAFFIQKAGVYGVKDINKYRRYLLTRGVILPQEGKEAVIERNGETYVAVDIAWIRVREYMRSLEKQLIRSR